MSLRMLVYLFTVELIIEVSAAIRRVPGSSVTPLHSRTWRHRCGCEALGWRCSEIGQTIQSGDDVVLDGADQHC